MNESDYTRNVNKKLDPSVVFHWKINDNFQGGVPDCWYLGKPSVNSPHGGNNLPLFVEYKYLKALPKRENTLIIPALTAQQLDWLNMLVENGQKALVIVGANFGHSNLGVVYEPSEWETGIPVTQFKERALDYAGLAAEIKNRLFSIAKN